MSLRQFIFAIFSLLVGPIFLAACGGSTPTATVTPIPSTPTLATLVPTPVPERPLTICMSQEPANLFPLNNPSAVARDILQAVYEGPIDTNSYGYQPVILKDLPSLANGDAQVFQQSVYVGDEVVDASDTPVTLAVGVKVRPAGCRSDSCAITYDGKGEIKMDQVQVTFRLLPGLTWSDGLPLTADDSVYAYSVANDPKIAGSRYMLDRTKTYEAADDVTVQWWGKPGFIDTTYLANFWAPLPKHLWSTIPAAQLAASADASQKPVGWGPYVIQDWVTGDHITLTKNPYYFRAAQGLPKYTSLTFRFIQDPGTAVSDLIAHTCDILDPSINLDGQVDVLRSMATQKQLQVLFSGSPVMEQLAFGIRPVSYDNGYNPGSDRPDYFGDPHVRQAVTMCIDRQKIVDTVLGGLSPVPATFVPADDPLYNSIVTTYSYDVAAANKLLENAGWLDTDHDPSTPRQAFGVHNVPDGTRFEIHYITTGAAQRVQVSSSVATSLAQCGIKVNIDYIDQAVLYAAGPGGQLFGRNFDLAEFAMGSTGTEPPCDWFSTSEIPTADNFWVGTNISGYSNPAYDEVCQVDQKTLADEPDHAQAYRQAQSIFSEDLPVLPLYWRVKVAAARPDMCHFSLDPTASNPLWNIANFDSGASCGQ